MPVKKGEKTNVSSNNMQFNKLPFALKLIS